MPRIQYQAKAEPVFVEPPSVESWFQPLTEPVRPKRSEAALVASGMVALFFGLAEPEPVSADSWYQPLSQPVVRVVEPIRGTVHTGFGVPAEVITPDKWYAPFGIPVKPVSPHAALTASGPVYVGEPIVPAIAEFGWFEPLSDPPAAKQRRPINRGMVSTGFGVPTALPVLNWYVALSSPQHDVRLLSPAYLLDPITGSVGEDITGQAASLDLFKSFSQPVLRKARIIPAGLTYVGEPTAPAAVPDFGWYRGLSRPAPKIPPPVIKGTTTTGFAVPTINTPDKWQGSFSQPVRRPVHANSGTVHTGFGVPAAVPDVVPDQSLQPFAVPVRPIAQINPGTVSTGFGVPFVASPVAPDQWFQPLSEPAKFRSTITRGTIATGFGIFAPSFDWFQAFSQPVLRIPQVPSPQPVANLEPLPTTQLPQFGWYAQLSKLTILAWQANGGTVHTGFGVPSPTLAALPDLDWYVALSQPPVNPKRYAIAHLLDPITGSVGEDVSGTGELLEPLPPLNQPLTQPPRPIQAGLTYVGEPIAPAPITDFGWFQPLSRSLPPAAISAFKGTTITGFSVPRINSPDKWHQPFSQPVRLPISINSGTVNTGFGVPTAAPGPGTELDTYPPLNQPVRPPLRVIQAGLTYVGEPIPTVPLPDFGWWLLFPEPVRPDVSIAYTLRSDLGLIEVPPGVAVVCPTEDTIEQRVLDDIVEVRVIEDTIEQVTLEDTIRCNIQK